jgi:HD-GYP domain-containing protein (c-di-GMP phosphodiesterase class II)
MKNGLKILIVEDELVTADSIQVCLIDQGYEVTGIATTGEAALKMADDSPPGLVLMDIRLNGSMDGVETARLLTKRHDVPVIYLTAYTIPDEIKRAATTSPYGYLVKPFEERELISNIEIAVQKHRADRLIRESEKLLRLSNEKLRASLLGIVQAMIAVVEARDPYTAGHQRRVAELTSAMAAAMGLSEDKIEGITLAASIHDLGKISIPSEILSKPTQISELEREIIKIHPRAGFEILKNIEFPWPIADIVHQHHEKIDGSGYPQGLTGDGMLPESRILVVADVVEAIASHRPYRPALGLDFAFDELAKHRGILYDADAVDACIDLFRTKGFAFSM